MRIGLTLLLVIHAAIHVLGFLKWSGRAAVPQLSGRTLAPLSPAGSTLYAWLWLAACGLWLLVAGSRFARHDSWWWLAACALVLSQAVIVFAWPDAKFGTAVNLVVLAAVVVAAAQARFDRQVDGEVHALLASGQGASLPVVRAQELEPLPPPVRAWLEGSGIVGKPRARTVRLQQRGELRTSPDGAWMPAQAEQVFVAGDPAFVWRVRTRMFGLLPIAGRDLYASGRGHMLIKAASLVNVVDVHDAKVAHGALLRFLGEIVWFPSAALSPSIVWRPIDATRAEATLRHAGITAAAEFVFDPSGHVVGLRAQRYLGGGADARLSPWRVTCTEWRSVRGVEVPVRGDVGWELPAGPFSYYRWQILDVEQDPALPALR